ncbi:MAG: tellurite resistance TerB family protein [Planctomycetaceae bacterium]|nr:tellurite resistance TerB family protein [Planctomycetaceae bacterium]
MGLFDSLFGGMESAKKLSPQQAFAGILLAAGACDGHISDTEADNLMTAVGRMRLFQRVSDKEFSQVMNKLMGILKKQGPEGLIDGCCAALPKELANAAFANACNIVLSDGVVDTDEKEFIERLRERLALDNNVAKAIAQVMVIKNKG